MKNFFKFMLFLLIVLVVLLVVDFSYAFFFKTKPFIIINYSDNKYSSLLYDVYLCNDDYIIKSKFSNYTCSSTVEISNDSSDIKIIDRSADICADVIDYYYEDDNYLYYFTCLKADSIYVIKDGNEYTIRDALNNGIVTMNELIDAGFEPLKETK